MTNDVCPGDPEILQQRLGVGSVLREAHRTGDVAAACASRSMVMHETITTGKGQLPKQWREPIGEDAGMNEDHWFAVAMKFVFQFHVTEYRTIHLDPAFSCYRTTRPML